MSGNGNWWKRGERGKITVALDPVLAQEARDLGIEESEIESRGGYRNDQFKRTHWIPLRQLIEYTKKDIEIIDDQDFWKWFDDFRKRESIGGRFNLGGSGSGSGWGSWGGSWGKPKDYLIDYWKGWGYSGNEKERKMAVALSAASTTVGVINDTPTRFHVQFSQQGANATNIQDREIVISPEPVLDSQISDERAIKLTTGEALHEGSHAKYTPSIAKMIEEPNEIAPVQISHLLVNLLEDLRIERLTSEKYPGFAEYLEELHDWGWEKQGGLAPKTWGKELKDKLNAIILMTKWSEEYEQIARADAELSAEFDWWKAWGESYKVQNDTSNVRDLVEAALARLRQDPDTAKQLQAIADAEEQLKKEMNAEGRALSDEEFKQFLDDLNKRLGDPSSFQPCPSPDHNHKRIKVQLTQEQAQQVKKMVEEQLEIKFSQFPDKETGAAPDIIVTKPTEDDASRQSYQPPNRSLVAKIKAAFFFRKRVPIYDDRMLKQGEVDDEQLWRVAGDDFRVFLRRHIDEEDFVTAAMLVDCSGSMHGPNIERAQMLATVLLECFATMPNARVKVFGHAHTGANDASVYRIWEPGDPRTRLGLFGHVPSGSNYDGYAIEMVARDLLEKARPNETMIMFVLSDGRPNGGHRYAGQPAMRHVRQVTDHFAKKGIAIIQIAVDPAVGPQDQAVMFANWIPFDQTKLPTTLGRLLIKMFGAEQ